MTLEEKMITPEGYRFTSTFRYPQNFLYIIAFLTPLPAAALYLLAVFGVFLPLQGGQLTFVIILTIFSPYMIREVIQRGIGRLLGYPISLSSLLTFRYAADFPVKTGGFRSYRDVLFIAIAPLSLYTVLLTPLLLGQRGTIGNMLTFIILMSLLPTASDVYFVCWLLTKSRKSLLYMQRRTALLFEPLQSDHVTTSGTDSRTRKQSKKPKHREDASC